MNETKKNVQGTGNPITWYFRRQIYTGLVNGVTIKVHYYSQEKTRCLLAPTRYISFKASRQNFQSKTSFYIHNIHVNFSSLYVRES